MSTTSLPVRRTPGARAGTHGTQSALAPNELLPALLHEARRYQLVLVSIFAAIALIALLVGLFLLPRKYVASTSVLAQESDILQPLLENRAVSTQAVDRAGLARQVGERGLVVLTDINAEMLARGRDRLINEGLVGNVRYAQANAERLPFARGLFDCVTIGFGLRNVTDKAAALKSMREVLKPGGQLLVLHVPPGQPVR